MGDITLRNIGDKHMHLLHELASATGRTPEEEGRLLLEQALEREGYVSGAIEQDASQQSMEPAMDPAMQQRYREFWEQADRFRASFGNRVCADSGEIASEMREERSRLVGEP
ncbi:hypothetical protein [Azospirillum rugosum]|uniref:Plasmid stability protein n=1 Tax=Azospirillum rugosum TaxID=416170 RepID=A0ABS4SVP2_9PROT|nr:hypothetical protein [Azospirillum rugosum]MBP2296631.1 plasmid stability protein [Azospirillum rugosum]MDQ0530310.1 plasmid stability protein [Azospirillum rugosum]